MISVIVCSIDPAKAATLHENIVQTIGAPFEFRVFDNREARKGICAVYNACAREARYDLLCFVHEDVRFLTEGWGAIIAERLMQPRCGVVGFAGGTMKLRGITGWCLDERDARTAYAQPDAAGRMIRHEDNPAGENFSRVVCLDGFCLFVRREVWESVLFDETHMKGFHGYDLDFSFATSCKYVNWVCHIVQVEHLSAGAYSLAWREALEVFHAKWRDRLPSFAAGPVPAEKAIEALEYKANALWWRKLIRLGLCTPEEARRAVAGLLRQRPFAREGWKTAFKWARFGIKTIEFGNKTPEIENKNTDSSIKS